MPRIVCISDTHNFNDRIEVPDGDILIHAGDATVNGKVHEVTEFCNWFSELPHKQKIYIAGNHDWLYFLDNPLARSLTHKSVHYLQDDFVHVNGLKIYGSPWQPRFFDWAFNLERGPEMAEKWAKIPQDVDILLTHGPPFGILDKVNQKGSESHEGCEELRKRVEVLAAFGKLKLHIFGHIHGGHGVHEEFNIKFINASICDEEYHPVQLPIIIDLPSN